MATKAEKKKRFLEPEFCRLESQSTDLIPVRVQAADRRVRLRLPVVELVTVHLQTHVHAWKRKKPWSGSSCRAFDQSGRHVTYRPAAAGRGPSGRRRPASRTETPRPSLETQKQKRILRSRIPRNARNGLGTKRSKRLGVGLRFRSRTWRGGQMGDRRRPYRHWSSAAAAAGSF